MTGEEMVLVAKIIAHVFGYNSEPLTNHDKEIAFEMIKHMTDQRVDMTRQQKEEFKMLVDWGKELSER